MHMQNKTFPNNMWFSQGIMVLFLYSPQFTAYYLLNINKSNNKTYQMLNVQVNIKPCNHAQGTQMIMENKWK